jgi:mRNA interferase RelE/StbE
VSRFAVELRPAAAKALRDLARVDAERIRAKLRALSEDPRPHGAEKLAGREGLLRVRVGDFRIVFRVDDGVLLVLVVAIGHRREVYR